MDEKYAKRIREECTTGDYEINGCNLDRIILNMLLELGMDETAKAFDETDCWRA